MTTMSADIEDNNEFEQAKKRLKQIVDQIDKNDLDIDEALNLYEEAVDLSVKASGSLEKGITTKDNVLDEDSEQLNPDNMHRDVPEQD